MIIPSQRLSPNIRALSRIQVCDTSTQAAKTQALDPDTLTCIKDYKLGYKITLWWPHTTTTKINFEFEERGHACGHYFCELTQFLSL